MKTKMNSTSICFIFACLAGLLFFTTTGQAQAPEWSVPLNVSGDGFNFTRTFSGDAEATDNFDNGLDVISPPPGQTYYAYFLIATFPYYLDTDVRSWINPYDSHIYWTLKIVNATSLNTNITWSSENLPSQGSFFLEDGAIIDMRTTSSHSFSGDNELTIHYIPDETVTYNLPSQGWYMVSLPVVPDDRQVGTLFPTALGGIAYNWKEDQSGYGTVTQLEPGKGYWIAIPGSTYVAISGLPFYFYAKHFAQGWYMIGTVLAGVDFTSPNDDPDGGVLTPAFGWTVPNGPYYGTTTLNEKEAYWIAVFAECDLTVGDGGLVMQKQSQTLDWREFAQRFGSEPPAPPYAMDVDVNESALPSQFKVMQNYPNPFNPETVIAFDLPANRQTKVQVYNTIGKHIRSLIDEPKNAGHHTVLWDGSTDNGEQAPSGLYFIQVSAGEFNDIIKAVLVR